MKVTLPSRSLQGSAVLIILAFLGIIVVLMASNSCALSDMDRNIRLTEQKQLRKFGVHPKDAPAKQARH